MAEKRYILLGLFFLAVQVVIIVRNYMDNYINFFWFCDFSPALFAIAFFLKKNDMAKALVNIGLIAQWIYLVAFFYNIFSGVSLIDALPNTDNVLYNSSAVLIHLSTTVALACTYKLKPSKKTLTYSIFLLVGIYLFTLAFAPTSVEVNYVLSASTLADIKIPYYTIFWIPIALFLVVLPTQGVQYIFYKSLKKM